MSRSNPTQSSNPATKFISFSGDKNKWSFWDKVLKEEFEVPTPFAFVVLDQLSTIKGYNDANKCGIYSNEIHQMSEMLYVKTFKGGIKVEGLWEDIKPDVTSFGGKFTKSVYAMLIHKGGENELVNINIGGAGLGGWIDVKKPEDFLIVVKQDDEQHKKGATTYYKPVFTTVELKKEYADQAYTMDIGLQEYLKGYKRPPVADDKPEDQVLEQAENFVEEDTLDW